MRDAVAFAVHTGDVLWGETVFAPDPPRCLDISVLGTSDVIMQQM